MLRSALALPSSWPHRVLLGLAALWIFLATVAAPLFKYTHAPSWAAVVTLVALVLAFCLGSVVVKDLGRRSKSTPSRVIDQSFMFAAAVLFAASAVILRAIDRIVIRGVSISLDEIASRKLVDGVLADESPLGLIAAPMMGFCLVPLILTLSYPKRYGWRSRTLAGIFASFPALEGLLFAGGTSYLAFTLILAFCAFACRSREEVPSGRRSSTPVTGRRSLAVIVALSIFAITLGGMVFKARIEEMTGSASVWLSYSSSSLYNVLVPSDLMIALVDIPLLGDFLFVVYWFVLYITSGVYNLLYVLDYPHLINSRGGTQAYVLIRAYSIIAGIPTQDVLAFNPLPGLYQTFFGDVVIDFGGVGGAIQSFVWGAVAAWAHVARLRGSLTGQILDPISKAFLIMGLFISSFTSFGIYVLLMAIATLAISHLRPHAARRVHA